MLRKEKNGIHWLEFELLADITNLKHRVFLRHGGCSQGLFESFNLCYNVGDKIENVEANLKKAAEILEVPELVWSEQHHGKDIELVTSEMKEIPRCDALVTSLPNKGLMVKHADCQAAILYDPIKRAVAAAHCGWRGSVQNIYASVIAFMKRFFNSSPENILVCISPSLGPESAEFVNYRKELPEAFWEFQIKPNYFDFWGISQMQLQNSGILKHHIQVAGIDTLSNPEDYFSYRYNKIRGGHGTAVALV